MNILDTISDIIFPSYCIACGKRGVDLCLDCLFKAPPALRENAEWIFPLFDYRHQTIKESIWLLKYKGRKKLAKIFAEVMYGRIVEELADLRMIKNFREALLIPIPLSNTRHRERSYNQAELICRELIRLDNESNLRHSVDVGQDKNFEFDKNILIKTKETEHQARIKERAERLKNLENSFAVKNPDKIKNRNVILVDDVTTTGATLEEAKKALKKSGAKNIIAFTVAH